MDNSLVPLTELLTTLSHTVLILVVMDNSLVLLMGAKVDIEQTGLNPCCNGQ